MDWIFLGLSAVLFALMLGLAVLGDRLGGQSNQSVNSGQNGLGGQKQSGSKS